MQFESIWNITRQIWDSPRSFDYQDASCGLSCENVQLLNSVKNIEDVADQIASISGPQSVVYFRPDLDTVFIFRDVLGRKSLVWAVNEQKATLHVACSVRPELASGWEEIPPGIVFAVSISKWTISQFYCIGFSDWPASGIVGSFNGETRKLLIGHDTLLHVNREVDSGLSFDPVTELFNRLKKCVVESIPKECDEVGVAFSGGIDSLLVVHSILASTNLSVTLVNVSFGSSEQECSHAPDRIRATSAWSHFLSLYPAHRLRLLLRNVNSEELSQVRKKFIAKAVAPCNTVLDDSLACVLWFALEGKGVFGGQSVRCAASNFFVGSGADELFAGYARHRTRFERDGASSIAEECEAELRRYGTRNGGRDARVALQLERNLIAPFLSDDIIFWANSLPILAKCDLSLPRGIGEKRIIRECLKRLKAPHDAPKQAMQFGSRMAKMTNTSKDIKGSDRSTQLSALNGDDVQQQQVAC